MSLPSDAVDQTQPLALGITLQFFGGIKNRALSATGTYKAKDNLGWKPQRLLLLASVKLLTHYEQKRLVLARAATSVTWCFLNISIPGPSLDLLNWILWSHTWKDSYFKHPRDSDTWLSLESSGLEELKPLNGELGSAPGMELTFYPCCVTLGSSLSSGPISQIRMLDLTKWISAYILEALGFPWRFQKLLRERG